MQGVFILKNQGMTISLGTAVFSLLFSFIQRQISLWAD